MSDDVDDYVEKSVRRRVGIAALKKLRRMVDADAAVEHAKARWACRLAWGFAIAALLALLWLGLRSFR
ncbi:MAG: hypothetical protein EKK46_14865 [Rhodocyclaceae bacterium]|nr:MAG: hypothetical protein EKK46_14865 [Rhodocyclaceae bacterium]